jgi:hypothetical protein
LALLVLALRAVLLLVDRAPAAGAACQPVPALSTSTSSMLR